MAGVVGAVLLSAVMGAIGAGIGAGVTKPKDMANATDDEKNKMNNAMIIGGSVGSGIVVIGVIASYFFEPNQVGVLERVRARMNRNQRMFNRRPPQSRVSDLVEETRNPIYI